MPFETLQILVYIGALGSSREVDFCPQNAKYGSLSIYRPPEMAQILTQSKFQKKCFRPHPNIRAIRMVGGGEERL